MKTQQNKSWLALLVVSVLFFAACEEEFYKINETFYDGMSIVVKNQLNNDTLRIEQYNTDKILIEEANDSTLIFDSKAFIYYVHHDSVLKVESDGTIKPLSRGTTPIDITFRANSSLTTRIFVEVYKDYHPVDYLQAASSINRLLVEKGYTLNLAPYIFVFPAHADNKKLHFSLDESSKDFASITSNGVITGKLPGTIQVSIQSDDNPNAKIDVQLTVVNEIEITDVVLHQRLNNVTLGLNERILLNNVTSVTPSNVNVLNKVLHFEITDGTGVVEIDPETNILRSISAGSATIKVTSKNNISKEFIVNVDADKKDLTRTFWTVNTSIVYATGFNYVVDGATGKPEDMFDDNPATFLSMVKPGKTFSGATGPAGLLNYFIVDMQLPCIFNSIRWNHRSGNIYPYLRVWGITIEGSNDGENWTTIATNIEIPNTKGAPNGADNNRHDISLGKDHEYRYVKIIKTHWSDNSGGPTSGSSMQTGEFGLSKF
jgi:hypothetical protein